MYTKTKKITPGGVREVLFLKNIKHQFIVKPNNCTIDVVTDTITINCPYLNGCQYLDMKTIDLFIGNIAYAIHYLHTNNIAHLDIKPANIVTDGNKHYLIDFDSAVYLTDESQVNSFTVNYAAPELLLNSNKIKNLLKADVWAFGVTIVELLTKKKLISYNSDSEILKKMLKIFKFSDNAIDNLNLCKLPYLSDLLKSNAQMTRNVHFKFYKVTKDLQIIKKNELLNDLLANMLNTDYTSRYSIEQVINHPYFKKYVLPLIGNVPEKVEKINLAEKYKGPIINLISGADSNIEYLFTIDINRI